MSTDVITKITPLTLLRMWLRDAADEERAREVTARKARYKGPLRQAAERIADAHAAAAAMFEERLAEVEREIADAAQA